MSQKQQFGASSVLSRSMVSLVVGLLYVAACACPAVKVKNAGMALINALLVSLGGKPDAQGPEYEEVLGVEMLLAGWRSPLIIPWSANLLLLGGWILLLRRKNAAALGFGIAAALAGLAGLSTWSLLPEREQLLVGSYLWQASLIVFALGALAIWFWEPRNEPAPADAADRERAIGPIRERVQAEQSSMAGGQSSPSCEKIQRLPP